MRFVFEYLIPGAIAYLILVTCALVTFFVWDLINGKWK